MLNGIRCNITSNAVKFTPAGGTVSISALPADHNFVKVHIKDTEIGMPGQLMEDTGKIDVEVRRKGTNGEVSSGLGLILVREFIEKNEGRFGVKSEVGKGSYHLHCPSNKFILR